MSGKAEVRNNVMITGMPHERLGRAHRLGMRRMVNQPAVECLHSTPELVEPVLRGEPLGNVPNHRSALFDSPSRLGSTL
jgi:hypothetical protein